MDIKRLRSLTTGRLHTEITHVYEDIEAITRTPGLMTHQIPNAITALKPWLLENVTDTRFWDDNYDDTHVGDIELPEMTEEERDAVLERFAALPSPLFDRRFTNEIQHQHFERHAPTHQHLS